jgi:hypothetical protein
MTIYDREDDHLPGEKFMFNQNHKSVIIQFALVSLTKVIGVHLAYPCK